ncbi:MAG: metalloregulator ArsR/SmtB family transcription factor [Oscillospiraceae bacterium]|nr:metalloregulator ArsR/SmtB family transcription factor [Ruminococcus sp.]MCD8345609.1 metalloregulator ArsR/SmtB family transcription factor [Oscillospiraceae bacterium]
MPEELLPHHHTDEYDIESLKKTLEKTDFQAVADVFRQLGDCSRVQIFWLLCHCEECVINISALMGMTSPAVSHHLKLLKASGLITSRREGKEVYYKAADTIQSQSLHLIIEKIMEITCPEE